jgi:CheY-like chemotaxis protein
VEAELMQVRDAPLGAGQQALVVEDDDEVMTVTVAMLTRFGYDVLCAGNGTDALEILKSDAKLDLLLSDVVMPGGINGIELAREAKEMREGIRILLASGNAADVLARHGAAGEFPVIGKPFRRAELAEFLRKLA